MFKSCLIVDDSAVIRKVAARILSDFPFRIIEAESGEVALERCRDEMPDAILLDWHMPGMDGHDFLAALMREPIGTKPFIVYATTENDDVDITLALANGADAVILKPFTRITLQEALGAFSRAPMYA